MSKKHKPKQSRYGYGILVFNDDKPRIIKQYFDKALKHVVTVYEKREAQGVKPYSVNLAMKPKPQKKWYIPPSAGEPIESTHYRPTMFKNPMMDFTGDNLSLVH